MKIPPKKPHFFKPILPGFKNGLKIPNGFLKYLKGHEHIEHAVLRRGSKQWRVKVNGRRIEEGWEKFAEKHDLQLGDLLVFRHEGNMEFEVSIFNSSHCDREYSEYLQQQEEANNVEETSKKFEFKEAATYDKPFGQSHFVCTIQPYCLLHGFLSLPQQFIKANGLSNKKCDLIIEDDRQRSWKLKLSSSKGRVYMGYGWRKLVADNCLKEGDHIMFEIVSNGETPIWKSQVVTSVETPIMRKFQDKPSPRIKLSNNASSHVEAATKKPFGQSYFKCTLGEFFLSKGFLYVPKHFAIANGLANKSGLIIRDERQRSWNFKLNSRKNKTEVYIGDGCSKFIVDNCLKKGDRVMFEVITNGETPIWKFQDVTDGETPVRDQGIISGEKASILGKVD